MPALWVSAPEAIRRASLKVTQLRVAIDIGFRVPRFIVTNDVDDAREFLRSCQSGVVVKALALPAILAEDRAAAIFTHLVTENDLTNIDSVRFGPTLLQEFVEKRMDVRVTVIGDELFAVGIEPTHREEARVDFRRVDAFALPHTVLTLPASIHTLCLDLVRRFDLMFGAIDLLLTPDGEYVFLEINPNGQWLWLEWATGVPLTHALCDLLTGASQERGIHHCRSGFVVS
ncbi:MAG: hypothetical protein H0T18_04920 [Chloroflexia bacterium]|nr:hypothetical protein [Chloroflexia bacterium]